MTTTAIIELAGLDGGRVRLTSDAARRIGLRPRGLGPVPGDEGWESRRRDLERDGGQGTRPSWSNRPPPPTSPWRSGSRATTALLLSVKGGGHNIAGTSIAAADSPSTCPACARSGSNPAQTGPRRPGLPAQRRRPGDPGARAGDGARLRVRDRGRRPHARRRLRLPDPPVRLDGRQPRRGRGRHRRRGGPDREPGRDTPTCSGRCGAAAATSASSPVSRSGCTTSARWSPAG